MAEAPDQNNDAQTQPQQPANPLVCNGPLLTTEECGRRLGLADWFQRMRQDEDPDWYFTAAKFSAFLVITEQKIWEYLGGAENINHEGLDLLLDHLAAAARYCEFSSPLPNEGSTVDSLQLSRRTTRATVGLTTTSPATLLLPA